MVDKFIVDGFIDNSGGKGVRIGRQTLLVDTVFRKFSFWPERIKSLETKLLESDHPYEREDQ